MPVNSLDNATSAVMLALKPRLEERKKLERREGKGMGM